MKGFRRRIQIYSFMCIGAIVIVFFAATYQSFRYNTMSAQIHKLEAVQTTKVEENKRAIAGISVLSTPARIDELAQKQKALVRNYPPHALYLVHASGEGSKPAGATSDAHVTGGSR